MNYWGYQLLFEKYTILRISMKLELSKTQRISTESVKQNLTQLRFNCGIDYEKIQKYLTDGDLVKLLDIMNSCWWIESDYDLMCFDLLNLIGDESSKILTQQLVKKYDNHIKFKYFKFKWVELSEKDENKYRFYRCTFNELYMDSLTIFRKHTWSTSKIEHLILPKRLEKKWEQRDFLNSIITKVIFQ